MGYELYCELLEQAVRKLKQLPPKRRDRRGRRPARRGVHSRARYVPDMRLKIDLYRRLARLATMEEWQDLRAELVDRFGPRPAEVERMLRLAKLRIWAHAWTIGTIHLEDSFVVFGYADAQRIRQLAEKSGKRLRVVDGQSAYLPVTQELIETGRVVDEVESLLQPE